MVELFLLIKEVKSDKENPLAFFEWFIETGFIDAFIEDFLKSGDGERDGSKWYSINPEEETYTQYISYNSVPDDLHGYEIRKDPDNKKWYVKTYSFNDFLSEILKDEYFDTISLINKLLPSKSSDEAKHLCNIWIDSLLFLREKCNEEPYAKYAVCTSTLEDIIRYVISKYPSLSPSIEDNPTLREIKRNKGSKQAVSILHVAPVKEGSPILDSKIFSSLAEWIYEDEPLFKYKNYYNKEEKYSVAQALRHITNNKPKKAPVVVEFNTQAGPANYIMKKLKDYFPKMDLGNVARSEKVKILDRFFDVDNCNTAYSRFKGKKELTQTIDSFFEDHLM